MCRKLLLKLTHIIIGIGVLVLILILLGNLLLLWHSLLRVHLGVISIIDWHSLLNKISIRHPLHIVVNHEFNFPIGHQHGSLVAITIVAVAGLPIEVIVKSGMHAYFMEIRLVFFVYYVVDVFFVNAVQVACSFSNLGCGNHDKYDKEYLKPNINVEPVPI